MPNVCLINHLRCEHQLFHPIQYVTDTYFRSRLLNGSIQFPVVWRGHSHYGRSMYIVTMYTIFQLALQMDPSYAEQIYLSGMMSINIDVLLACVSVRNFTRSENIVRIIDHISRMNYISGSSAGVTIHSCIQIFDEEIRDFNDHRFFNILENLNLLYDRSLRHQRRIR